MSRPQRVPECTWRFQLGNALLLHIIETFSFGFSPGCVLGRVFDFCHHPPAPQTKSSGCSGKKVSRIKEPPVLSYLNNQESNNLRFFVIWGKRPRLKRVPNVWKQIPNQRTVSFGYLKMACMVFTGLNPRIPNTKVWMHL